MPDQEGSDQQDQNNSQEQSEETPQTTQSGLQKPQSILKYPTRLNTTLSNRNLKDELDENVDQDELETSIQNPNLPTRLGEAKKKGKPDPRKIMHKDRREAPVDSMLLDPRAYVPPTPKDYNTILKLFQSHVVELRFKRRLPLPFTKPPGHSKPTRRMMCTSNWKFLSSIFTRKVFGWRQPKNRRGVAWYKSRDLLITWDLMVNNFRIISLDDWEILGATPVMRLHDKATFLVFFKNYVRLMKTGDIDKFKDN